MTEPLDEQEEQPWDELWRSLIIGLAELGVSLGMVSAVMQNYPEDVQRGFIERLERLISNVDNEIAEIHAFGEAYDSDD